MDYDEFKDYIKEQFMDKLGTNCEISFAEYVKNNDCKMEGMSVKRAGDSIAPILYPKRWFEMVSDGSMSADESVEQMLESYKSGVENGFPDVDDLFDYDKVKDRIIFRIINKKRNENALKEMPYVEYLDFAIIFAVQISVQEADDALINIRYDLAGKWNVGADELMSVATENTPRINSWSLTDMYSLIAQMSGVDKTVMMGENDIPMYILSNTRKLNGAGCILYPGVLAEVADMIGDDLYIIPSSIHEIITIPASIATDSSNLTEIIRYVNDNSLSEVELLSDHPYYYSREKEELTAA